MPSEFWRKFRVAFRWCRISILLLILAGACLLLWFNLVGLPDTLKNRLLADLQKRGVTLQFSRMRLRMTRGIVVDNAHMVAADNTNGPSLYLGEAQLLIDFPSLLRGHLHIEGLVLREGRLVVPVNDSAQASTALELDNIQTNLRFQDDTWSLDNFVADFHGAKLFLAGDVAHARDFRNWDIFRPRKTTGPHGGWAKRLENISQILDEIHLQGTPLLTMNFEGDARDPQSFAIRLQVTGPSAQTPWFSASDIKFKANLTIPAGTPTNLPLLGIWSNLQPYRVVWSAHFTQMKAKTTSAEAVDAHGFWRAPDMAFNVRLQEGALTTRRPVSVQNLQFNAYLTAPARPVTNPVLSGIWSNLQPWQLSWSTRLDRLRSEQVNAESVSASGYWRSPKLVADTLSVRLGHGFLHAGLEFDAGNDWLTFTNSSAFDPRVVEPLLPAALRRRLALVTWTTPPALRAAGVVDLSSLLYDSKSQAGPSPVLDLHAEVAFANATVAGLLLDQVRVSAAYSNLVWKLPDVQVVREKTRLQLQGSVDETTKLFHARLQGAFDVNQIRPWLKSKTAAREVGRLTFHEPMMLDVTVGGNLQDPGALGVAGNLAITNLAARGGPLDSLVTGIMYTNRVIEFRHPVAWREHGSQTLTADAITLDLNVYSISFTNGFSTASPQVVADSIGPKTGRIIEPYQFLKPPTARVNGCISLRSSEDNAQIENEDLQVEILKGAPFRWLRFNTREVTGTIHWFGPTLLLTNLNAEFYGGRAAGKALFDFRPAHTTDFNFAFDITNANLHWLVADLASSSNKLEGLVTGHLVCTSGTATNWQGMNGYGNATLRDGLLWDAPMFGILSPAMNALVPGLGSSRATDAGGSFTMTNGVLYSNSLEIHTSTARLHYEGTVDLHENLPARAPVQILRDTPGLGTFLHVVTWPVSKLFEYKVTGTLDDPKMTPLNDIAKLILAPLHPIKTLEHILPVGNTNAVASTNAPAKR
jgi:hypothetical protein